MIFVPFIIPILFLIAVLMINLYFDKRINRMIASMEIENNIICSVCNKEIKGENPLSIFYNDEDGIHHHHLIHHDCEVLQIHNLLQEDAKRKIIVERKVIRIKELETK